MEQQKTVAAIHDISGFGKCSLTVVLPILSAAGIQTSVVPTAVLSTHTGGAFRGYTYRDLTPDLPAFAAHWNSLGLKFDAIYSGFLGSFDQISIVSQMIDLFRKDDSLVMVDPVMGDNGRLYSTYTPEMAKGMRELCAKADIVVPNMTEAAFLLREEFFDGPYRQEHIEEILLRLCDLGPKQAVITGVWFTPDQVGSAGYCRETKEYSYAFSRRAPGMYHGTGDIYGSVLLSALLNGLALQDAMEVAVDFTCESILRTLEAGTKVEYGVNFEAGLPKLMQQLHFL